MKLAGEAMEYCEEAFTVTYHRTGRLVEFLKAQVFKVECRVLSGMWKVWCLLFRGVIMAYNSFREQSQVRFVLLYIGLPT